MNRDEFAKNIIRVGINCGGYVFGGFVRDSISGDKFKDIDIYLGTDFSRVNTFLRELNRAGLNAKQTPSKALYLTELTRHKFIVSHSGYGLLLPIEVDCVIANDGKDTPFRMGKDADVNFLCYTSMNGSTFGSPSCPAYLDIQTVINHVLDRQYMAGNEVHPGRIAKLEAKGYTRVGTSEPSKFRQPFAVKVVEKAAIAICPECNGLGKIDKGFYVQSCPKCQQHTWEYHGIL